MVSASTAKVLVGAGGLVAGAGALVWRRRRHADGERPATVTVLRPEAEISSSPELGALRAVGPSIQVELRAAPGGRGTEVTARRGPGRRGRGERDLMRARLRELKQTLETGEVLHATPRPQGRRPPTPGGLVIDAADRKAMGKGVL